MHFLISSMSPLSAPKDMAKLSAPRTLDQIFTEVFSREHQVAPQSLNPLLGGIPASLNPLGVILASPINPTPAPHSLPLKYP